MEVAKMASAGVGGSSPFAWTRGSRFDLELPRAKALLYALQQRQARRRKLKPFWEREPPLNLDTAKTEIARLTEESDVGRREQNRLQSNLTAAGGLVVDLKGQPNRANLLVDRLSKLKGVDELIGAAAAQAHSGAEQDKAVGDVTALSAEQDAAFATRRVRTQWCIDFRAAKALVS